MDLGVLERSPEAGDVEAVDGVVAGYAVRAERFGVRAVAVRAAGDGLVAASAGDWASALGERSVRLAAGFDDAAGGCRQVAAVLAGYGAALRGVQRRVRAARHEVATARSRAVAARERYAAAVVAGGGAGVPWSWTDVPAFPAVAGAAAELAAWREAVGDAVVGVRAFEACCEDRESLDRDTAARLAGVEVMAAYAPGTGVDAVVDVPLVQALAAAGSGRVTAAQRRVMAEWFVGTTEQVSNYPRDAQALAALSGFLDAWGDDAEVMAAVFAAVGGARVVRLVTMLGEQMVGGGADRDQALAAAGRGLRWGLASASSTWSRSAAAAFAADMVRAASSANGTLSAIGFVFADPQDARMSEAFTVAMADLLDAIERGNGGPWRDGPGSPGHALDTDGLLSLDSGGAYDAAARVFETLGAYPQAARDWLTGEGVDWSSRDLPTTNSRIAYWFGTRDWALGASDGFTGVGVLWAGLQAEPGADAVSRQVAALNTLAFDAVWMNPSLLPGEVSTSGSEALAQVVAGQLPGLIQIGFESGGPDAGVGDLWREIAVPYLPERTVTGYVAREWVGPVMTAATSHAEGRSLLQSAVLTYQETAFESVTAGASASRSLETVVSAWAAVDGASVTATEVEQYLHDQQTKAGLTAARAVADTAVALSPLRPMSSIGVDAALELLHRQAETQLTGGDVLAPAVRSLLPDGVGTVDEFVRATVVEYQRIGRWDRPVAQVGDTADVVAADFARQETGRYEDVVGAVRARSSDKLRES
ncbi:hypothetical protein [Cellulomonas wangsupingiae]|uniref:hypothetical protein n=1 Tax=Cellulomonas wangsupingiae TaxID=2968085 RepID=UPI001D0E953A|nr:hypothetical protein [Cellulomonas wangsupingiae]MCM0639514.1 hypothetical protein [Cellulomonas wangsupingiae]